MKKFLSFPVCSIFTAVVFIFVRTCSAQSLIHPSPKSYCYVWPKNHQNSESRVDCHLDTLLDLEQKLLDTQVPKILPKNEFGFTISYGFGSESEESLSEDRGSEVQLSVDCKDRTGMSYLPRPGFLPRSLHWLHNLTQFKLRDCRHVTLHSIIVERPLQLDGDHGYGYGNENDDPISLENLRSLSLVGNGLEYILPGIFLYKTLLPNLNTLDLMRNQLIYIPSGTFEGLSALSTLILSENGIKILKPGVFSDTPKLRVLTLDANKLTEFPFEALLKCNKLEKISLMDNKIRVLRSPGSGWTLPGLTRLMLDSNEIHTLTPDFFLAFPKLRSLYLRNNRITRILPVTFSSSLKLTTLDLAANGLNMEWQELDPIFSHLDLLKDLDLSDNKLGGVLDLSSVIPPQLGRLQVDGNNLTHIGRGKCRGQYPDDLDTTLDEKSRNRSCSRNSSGNKLRSLSIRYNQLTTLSASALPPSLVELKASWNKIERIEPWTFSHLHLLMSVDLSNNRIATLDPVSICLPPRLSKAQIWERVEEFITEDEEGRTPSREDIEDFLQTSPQYQLPGMTLAEFDLDGNPFLQLTQELPAWLVSLCKEQQSRDVSKDIYVHPCLSPGEEVTLDLYNDNDIPIDLDLNTARLPKVRSFGPKYTCSTPTIMAW